MGAEFYGESYKGNDEPIFGGIPTFLKLPWLRSHEELKKVRPDVAIIGEPFDFGTTIRPGARYGPRAIRAASTVPSPPYEHFNIETGMDPFGVFKTADYGDVVVSPGDVVESLKRMTDKVKEVLDIDGLPVMLGGDHSVTFANVRAFAKKYKNIGMIHIDTHAHQENYGTRLPKRQELYSNRSAWILAWTRPLQMDGRPRLPMVYHVRCGRVRN